MHNTLADKSIAVIPCGLLKCLSVPIRGCFRFQSDSDGVVYVKENDGVRQGRRNSVHWVAVCFSAAAWTEKQMC